MINEVENKFQRGISKENIEKIKDDLRNQLYTAIKKDEFINKEDAELINAFIDKIKKILKIKNN